MPQRLRGDRLPRLRGLVQLDVGVAQSDVRERELRIESQRLMKRSRRFDPHIVVQVGETLIVETLRLRGLGPRIVMDRADAGAQRDRALEQRLRNRGNGMRRVLRLRNEKRRRKNEDRQQYKEKAGSPR